MDEVGKKLRSARIEKGYTLDDLQQITKIQKRYLNAIENGDYDQLPGDFYVRAFIKQYAETVGLNGQELLEEYQDDIPDPQPQEYQEESVENKKRDLHEETNTFSNWLRDNMGKLIIGVVVVIVIASLYFFAVHAANRRKTTIPDQSSDTVVSSSKKSSSKKEKSSSESSSQSESSESSQKSSSSSKKDELTVTAAEGSTNTFNVQNLPESDNTFTVGASDAAAWISVTPNSGSSWQGVLQAGGTHAVTIPDGTTSITLQSGNTPQTTVKINDKTVSLPTGSSVVQTFTFNIQAKTD